MEELPSTLPVISQVFAGLAVGGYFIFQAVGKMKSNGRVSKDTAAIIKAIEDAAERYQHGLADVSDAMKRHEESADKWRTEVRPIMTELQKNSAALLSRK